MISKHNFVSTGLLLVTLTIFIVGAESRAIDNSHATKRHVQDHIVLYKRQADDIAPDVPEKHHRSHKPPSPKPKAAHAEGEKASTKKRNKADKAKKLMDDVVDADKTTTKKPKQERTGSEKASSSTGKPHSHQSAKNSTKKPVKKNDKEKGEKEKEKVARKKDEDKSDDDGDQKKKAGKSTTEKPVTKRKLKMKTEEKLKVANERWLQNQEVVAIEHMLAGVYDWIKVLKQTGGKTYNKKTAGELFDKVNNELSGMLSEQNKPKKLVAYYRQMKIK